VTFGYVRPLRSHPAEDANEHRQRRVASVFGGYVVPAEDAQFVLTPGFHWFKIKLVLDDRQERDGPRIVQSGLNSRPDQP
jgi:hypothetical protein